MKLEQLNQSDIDYKSFCRRFLRPENPVILKGVQAFRRSEVSPRFIKERYQDRGTKVVGWYNLPLIDDDVLEIPRLVRSVMERDDMCLRARPMRIFMQPKGNHTPPHYDGNSLHGFNLQVAGRKRWTITSPKTPLPNSPFNFFGLVDKDFEYNSSEYDYFEFETSPGDMLFLPRYWYHEVESLEEANINVNWVFTPRQPNESTPLGQREAEIVKIRKLFPFLNEMFFLDDFSDYGGGGDQVIEDYSRNVGLARVCKRLAKELSCYPRYLRKSKVVDSRIDEMIDNNFRF